MPAARGSRGPRRGRGSCPKLLCAYRGCRSKRDVKNLGKAFSAPRDAVTESQCRRRLPNGPLLRADSPAPRHVSRRSPAGAAGSPGAWAVHAHDRDVSESRSPLAGALDAAAARVRRARGVHLPRALQLAQPLEPEGQQPRHHQDPPGQPEDETEGIPMAPDVAGLLNTWITKGLRGEAGSRWPFAGQKTRDLDTCLFPGLRAGGNKYRRTWAGRSQSGVTAKGSGMWRTCWRRTAARSTRLSPWGIICMTVALIGSSMT